MERTIAITSSSSNLSLAFLTHHATQPSTHILALDPNPPPTPSPHLKNTTHHQTDTTSPSSLAALSTSLKNRPIHLLIHSATQAHPRAVAAAETLTVIDHAIMMRTFEVNAWDALNTIRTLLPHLQRAATYAAATPPPKVVVMASRMGSVGASKAALNAVVKSLSVDVEGVVFLALHPGRVETGLVGWGG